MGSMTTKAKWLWRGAELVGAIGVVAGAGLLGLAALDFVSYAGFLVSLSWR